MEILDYLRRLLPVFKKDILEEDLKSTKDELTELSSYISIAAEHYKSNKFTRTESKKLEELYFRFSSKNRSFSKQSNMFADIEKALPQISANLNFIEQEIKDYLASDIIKDAVDVKKANLIQVVEAAAFITKYSMHLLNRIHSLETNMDVNDDVEVMDKVTVDRVAREMESFASFVIALSVPTDKFKTTYENLPPVIANTSNASVIKSQYTNGAISLLPNTASGFIGSPVLWVRSIDATYQAKRYKQRKDTLKVLELRMLQLKSKETNPSLEKQISVLQGRINAIQQENDDYEKYLGLR